MKKVLDYLKKNRKIIIVVVFLVVLLCAVYVINRSVKKKESAPTSVTNEKSLTEQKLCSILESIDGVGQTDVLINESENGITGVVIVCEGAKNIMTRNSVINVVSTALSIDKSIIAIYSMTV